MNQELDEQFGIVLVTVPSKEQAAAIAQTLVKCNLAACVNFFPVQSVYVWQNAIHYDDEWQLVIKSSLVKFAALETKIRAVHPYEVPEIIALPIQAGSLPYLQWISNSVNR